MKDDNNHSDMKTIPDNEIQALLTDQGLLFKTMLEASQDGVAILDENFALIECNLSFSAMLGYGKEELIGKNAWYWDAQWSKSEIQARLPDFTSLNEVFLTKHRHKNGSILDIEISAAGTTVNGVSLMVAVCRSVTERMKERKALMKTQFAMDHARDNCIWINGSGKIIYVNKAACKSLEYNQEELLQMTLFDIDPSLTGEDFKNFGVQMQEGKTMLFETIHKSKSGRMFPVEVSSNFFNSDDDLFTCSFDRDISARKKAEEELQQSYDLLEQRVAERTKQLSLEVTRRRKSEKELKKSQTMFKTLADSSPDVITRFDRQYRQVYVSPAVLHFIGIKPAELLGKTLHQIPITQSLAPHFNDILEGIFASGTSDKIEVQLPNGIWVEAIGAPEFDEEGRVVAVMTTTRDITSRKKVERELQIVNDFQALLMELATSFINLPLAKMNETFREALGKIGPFIKADRIYVFDFDANLQQCHATHEWLKDSIVQRKTRRLGRNTICTVHDRIAHFRANDFLHVPDANLLEAADPLKAVLADNDIKTLVIVPLIDENGPIGCLGIESVTTTHAFTGTELQLLKLFSQMVLNIKKRQQAEQAISNQREFQEMIAAIATDFINVSKANFDRKISTILQEIGEFLGIDRTALFLFSADDLDTERIKEWCRSGVKIQSNELTPHPILHCTPEQKQRMWKNQKMYHFPKVEEIPRENQGWREVMESLGIKSALFLPIHTEEQIYGMIGFETAIHYFSWSSSQINGLRVIAQIIANGITSIQHRKKLQEAKSQLEDRVRRRTRELEEQINAKEKALKELDATQSSLLEASRHAGMAEVATNVLHNVGNVLNSVNVSCTLLKDQLKESRIDFVEKVADILSMKQDDLSNFLTNSPQGRQLPTYLHSLSQALKKEREKMLAEAELLSSRTDHIKEIVAMQQNFGRIYGIKETIAPEQLLNDALKLNDEALRRHNVQVKKIFTPVAPITVDRHKVLQILLNLISNAKYACNESKTGNKIITLRLSPFNDNFIRIQVTDNGIGIRPEQLEQIFRHGFTTRENGHGFGLHSSALAARQLGGRLSAASDGPGCGATFTLDLPLHQGEQ